MTASELKFFDNIAPVWDSHETMSLPEKVSRVLDLVNIRPGQHILDLGTGTGVLIPELCRRVGSAGSVTAVDLSTQMLRQARAKTTDLTPKPEFINADFEQTPLPGKYDHIILYCVYPHLDHPIHTLHRLMERNLSPGGDITIAFPCSEDVINHIHGDKHVDSSRLLSAPDLAAHLREHGLPAHAIVASDDMYLISISCRSLN